MFTATVEDTRYTISFKNCKAVHPRLGRRRTATVCTIAVANSGRVVSEGIAYLKPSDLFDQAEGEKQAFRKATAGLWHSILPQFYAAFARRRKRQQHRTVALAA